MSECASELPPPLATAKAKDDERDVLTAPQAARLLGVSSANTVKNWLQGGHFPGAFRTAGGHWRFPKAEVEAARERMQQLAQRNLRGELSPPDVDQDDLEAPNL